MQLGSLGWSVLGGSREEGDLDAVTQECLGLGAGAKRGLPLALRRKRGAVGAGKKQCRASSLAAD